MGCHLEVCMSSGICVTTCIGTCFEYSWATLRPHCACTGPFKAWPGREAWQAPGTQGTCLRETARLKMQDADCGLIWCAPLARRRRNFSMFDDGTMMISDVKK